MRYAVLFTMALALLPLPAVSRISRSHGAKSEFQRQQPCPATGSPTGPCEGYVVDHILPLACGGADSPENMQWQTVADGRAKDKWERKACGG